MLLKEFQSQYNRLIYKSFIAFISLTYMLQLFLREDP